MHGCTVLVLVLVLAEVGVVAEVGSLIEGVVMEAARSAGLFILVHGVVVQTLRPAGGLVETLWTARLFILLLLVEALWPTGHSMVGALRGVRICIVSAATALALALAVGAIGS